MSSKSRRVPLEQRRRTEHSCDRCKTRKQKCSTWPGQDKCRHCLKYGYECVITKPRKQRIYGSIESHSNRMAILESLVKGLMPEADLSSIENMQEMARSLGIPVPEDSLSGDSHGSGGDKDCEKENEQLVHDLQGQDQYIGQASSYFFQMKLRALVSRNPDRTVGRMFLFGPNPASSRVRPTSAASGTDQLEVMDIHSIASAASPVSSLSSVPETSQTNYTVVLQLVQVYFEQVNVDFPVLHEATFLERIDEWCKAPNSVDPSWLCVFLCVLILARRLCTAEIREEQEEKWWCQIQSLLSKVIFTSSLTSIQALMLASLYLHHTNSRDTCWTLTGAAVRIGFAIGLHKDTLETNGTPLSREMRKRVWWTLYMFEQLQVSSHDRPSVIDNAKHLGSSPRESILDMSAHNPPEYVTWANRLVVILGSACRVVSEVSKESSTGPLSPAAGLLRELSRWRSALPKHLTPDLIDAMPPSFQRPLILLHIQYHYVVSLISRNALLARFTALSNNKGHSLPENLVSMSKVCMESGISSSLLLQKLNNLGKFNAVIWFDSYYLYSSALVLVLSIICAVGQKKPSNAAEPRKLLQVCTNIAAKYMGNPTTPGTMQRWLTVVEELNSMVLEFLTGQPDQRAATSVTKDSDTITARTIDTPMDFFPPSESLAQLEDALVPARDKDGTSLVPAGLPPPTFPPNPFASLDTESFGPNSQDAGFGFLEFGETSDSRFWHEMHWEGISDMLLGNEMRTWTS